MAFVVVYDACALYGNTVRNLLIRLAQARTVQAKWTDRILDELDRALGEKRGIPPEKPARLRTLINASVADCLVTGYEPLIAVGHRGPRPGRLRPRSHRYQRPRRACVCPADRG